MPLPVENVLGTKGLIYKGMYMYINGLNGSFILLLEYYVPLPVENVLGTVGLIYKGMYINGLNGQLLSYN